MNDVFKWCTTCKKNNHNTAECWGLGTVAVLPETHPVDLSQFANPYFPQLNTRDLEPFFPDQGLPLHLVPLSASRGIYVDAEKGNDLTGNGSQTLPFKSVERAMLEKRTLPSNATFTIHVGSGAFKMNALPPSGSTIRGGPRKQKRKAQWKQR